MNDAEDKVLNQYFTAAKSSAPRPPADLVGRVMEDAARVQAGTGPGRWRILREMLGGWTGIGGLAAACAAGVWIGYAVPGNLPDPLQLVQLQTTQVDLLNDEDLFAALAEEE